MGIGIVIESIGILVLEPMPNGDGQLKEEKTEVARILNNFFSSVFTREPVGPVVPEPESPEVERMPEFKVSLEEVEIELKSLRPDKSPGPDGISSIRGCCWHVLTNGLGRSFSFSNRRSKILFFPLTGVMLMPT
jgi:hypothetical protein